MSLALCSLHLAKTFYRLCAQAFDLICVSSKWVESKPDAPVHILLQFSALSTVSPEDYRPSTSAGLVHLEEVLEVHPVEESGFQTLGFSLPRLCVAVPRLPQGLGPRLFSLPSAWPLLPALLLPLSAPQPFFSPAYHVAVAMVQTTPYLVAVGNHHLYGSRFQGLVIWAALNWMVLLVLPELSC